MILMSSTLDTVWWAIRVWDSNDSNACDQYISIILNQGVCSVDGTGDTDDSDCTAFSDSSDWDAADNYLNDAPNTNNADLSGAADMYTDAKNLVNAAIAFSVATIVCAVIGMCLGDKTLGRDKFQIISAVLGLLATLLILCSFGITGNTDMTDADYWEILSCPDFSEANGTFANSEYSAPLTGYGLAIVAFFFQIASLAVFAAPGTCCFCSSACCAFAEEKDEVTLETPIVNAQ
jgi:hypothetical protein